MIARTPETLQTVIHTFCVRWRNRVGHSPPSLSLPASIKNQSLSIRPLLRPTPITLPLLPNRVRRRSAHIPSIILIPRINSVLIPIIHLLLQRRRPLPTTTTAHSNPLLMPRTNPLPQFQIQLPLPNLIPCRRHSSILPHPSPLHHPRMIHPTNPHRHPTPSHIRHHIEDVKHPSIAGQHRLEHLAADGQAESAHEQGEVQGAAPGGVDYPVEGGCEEEEGQEVQGFVVYGQGGGGRGGEAEVGC